MQRGRRPQVRRRASPRGEASCSLHPPSHQAAGGPAGFTGGRAEGGTGGKLAASQRGTWVCAKTQPKEMMVFTTMWEARGANEEPSVTHTAQGRPASHKMSTPVLPLISASKPHGPKATKSRGSRVAATYGSENRLPGAHYFSKAFLRQKPHSTQRTLLKRATRRLSVDSQSCTTGTLPSEGQFHPKETPYRQQSLLLPHTPDQLLPTTKLLSRGFCLFWILRMNGNRIACDLSCRASFPCCCCC